MVRIPPIPSNIIDLVVWLVGLLVLWVLVSIPVYFAGRAVTGGKSSLGSALRATLFGAIAYFIVFFLVAFFLEAILPDSAGVLATILGIIAWLAVYKGSFDTGWLGAVGIVILAWIILLVLDVFLILAFGVKFPDFFPF